MKNVFIILRNVFTYLYHFKICKFDSHLTNRLQTQTQNRACMYPVGYKI